MSRRWCALVTIAAVVFVACGSGAGETGEAGTIRILLTGDVMLGRGVAAVVAGDPEGLFRDVRRVIRDADLAMGNLESPLTDRPHTSANPYALEADPAAASLLAAAGFDVMSLANNHAGDAGPESVIDTLHAVEETGMAAVGGGADRDAAASPLVVERSGVRVAVLAFDTTGAGLAAGDGPGVTPWDPAAAEKAVRDARANADIVVVSLHGGVEYLPEPDLFVGEIAEQVITWGADVVWGHGPHVPHPPRLVDGDGRVAVAATSLGNFIFDQRGPQTGGGMILEILAGTHGVIAYRTAATTHRDLRVHFEEWELPARDAAYLDGEWWSLVTPPPIEAEHETVSDFPWGDVIDVDEGHVTEAGSLDVVVSFRHLPGPHPVRDGLGDVDWTDALGRTAHLGIYRAADLDSVWVAGMVPAPIGDVAACDGSIAMAYTMLDDASIVATGAAEWRPYGLDASPRLEGPGVPGCLDVDEDGATDPVIRRS